MAAWPIPEARERLAETPACWACRSFRTRSPGSGAQPETSPGAREDVPLTPRRIYFAFWFAASAASLSSLFTRSSNSFAFWAWPLMSHSLARCANAIFS